MLHAELTTHQRLAYTGEHEGLLQVLLLVADSAVYNRLEPWRPASPLRESCARPYADTEVAAETPARQIVFGVWRMVNGAP